MYASAFVLGFHGCDESVRGAFFEGEPLYEGTKIMAKTHIQVCIRKPSSIRGYFRPTP